jgi:hypothetical protein
MVRKYKSIAFFSFARSVFYLKRQTLMVGVPLRRGAPSYEQQTESKNGRNHARDQEPNGPVTRRTGEE